MVIAMYEHITRARDLLRTLTPLNSDCGRYCGGACCASDSEDEQGMLLFPGEERLYSDCEWAKVLPARFLGLDDARMLVCRGECPRDERPLACRLFPIAPRLIDGKCAARLDRRAFGVCPLTGYGIQALSGEFIRTCEQVFDLLCEDEDCLRYISAWSYLMDEYERGL